MPFGGLTNREFSDLFNYRKQDLDDTIMNNNLRDHMNKLYGNDVFQNLDCSYITPDHFNHTFTNVVELSVFHVNIQCLNSKHRALCQFARISVLSLMLLYYLKYGPTMLNFTIIFYLNIIFTTSYLLVVILVELAFMLKSPFIKVPSQVIN